MVESQGMEYLVLYVPPGHIISEIPTIAVKVDRLGSSIPSDLAPTPREDGGEAEHENEEMLRNLLNN